MASEKRETKVGYVVIFSHNHAPTQLTTCGAVFDTVTSVNRYIEDFVHKDETTVVSIIPTIVDAKYELVSYK